MTWRAFVHERSDKAEPRNQRGGGGGGGGGGVTGGGTLGGGDTPGPGGGGWGVEESGAMHADRSKNMNARALACADIPVVLQPSGNGTFGSESSPPSVPLGSGTPALMWRSVNTTRPHWLGSGAKTGVLNVMY